MIIEPTGLTVSADLIANKTTVSNSEFVYCCNRRSSGISYVQLLDTSDDTTRTASFAIPPNSGLVIIKKAGQFIFSSQGAGGGGNGSNVGFTPIRYGS